MTDMRSNRIRLAIGWLSAIGVLAAPAQAQEWPAKPVKIVVPFAAGGTYDELARLLTPELSAVFKQQFYVENRVGSSGAVGSAQVARAEPDGYTFVNAGSGPHLTGPAINPNIGYDPLKDFTHVAMVAADSFVLVAGTAVGAKSMADLGQSFGASLTESEVRYLMANEWARTAEDIVWRRSKLGLRLSATEITALDEWIAANRVSGDRPLREAGGRP